MKKLSPVFKSAIALLTAALMPSTGWACACGCDVFDVGTSSCFRITQGERVRGLRLAGPVECIETREEVMLYDKRIPAASTANIAITKSTLRQILPGGSGG